jgi:predicted ABC-type sugar transport system permease subunit
MLVTANRYNVRSIPALLVLQNGMDLVGLQAYWQIFIEGIVLIIAVTIDEYFRRRRQREE